MGEIVAKLGVALLLLAGTAGAQPKFETASVRLVEKFAREFPSRRIAPGASPDDAALMLQGLLVERFRLKMRRDTRQMRGYVLTVGKEGVKFAESPPITAPVEPEAPRPGGLRFEVD
jgi:hypothetical protein